jgi:AcrR family transcriptional regulator
MAESPVLAQSRETRIPLTRERLLEAAVGVADQGGIESLTMRNVAHELGVEAMSLYYHVANKEALLDGIVEVLMAEIEDLAGTINPPHDDWKGAMRLKILVSRQVLLRHPWAPGLIESRTNMSLAIVRYFDAVLGLLRQGGFSYDLAHHALHALGSRALGFTQELFEPDDAQAGNEASTAMLAQMADELPHLVGMMSEISHDDPDSTLGWCDDQTEFEFGLDLILNGLDQLRPTA